MTAGARSELVCQGPGAGGAGGIYDFFRTDHAKFGVGGLVSFYGVPDGLKPVYGDPTSAMAFVRLKIE